jgi:hypothetical protein
MTCGICVVCVPTLSRALKESPLVHKIKRSLGIKCSTVTTSGARRDYGTSAVSHKISRRTTSTNNVYREIDEDGVPLGRLPQSESDEHLHNSNSGIGYITRTTYIAVTRGVDLDRDLSSIGRPRGVQIYV